MDISPNPYRGKTALADEHSDVLLAACTHKTFVFQLLDLLIGKMDDEGEVVEGTWYGPWSYAVDYQAVIEDSNTEKRVDVVDARIRAKRLLLYPEHLSTETQHEVLLLFADAALGSVARLQKRLTALDEATVALQIVITRRGGLAVTTLLRECIVIIPTPDAFHIKPETAEALPELWTLIMDDVRVDFTLDMGGLCFIQAPVDVRTHTNKEIAAECERREQAEDEDPERMTKLLMGFASPEPYNDLGTY